MNKVNYQTEMEKIISEIKKSGVKPTLLLHACCAPCASACIERIKDFFDLIVYFYNPNIDGEEEYYKRAHELERLCDFFNVPVIVENFCAKDFYDRTAGYEDAPEGGSRCALCFDLRLAKTADKAVENGFQYFATTLTLSPLKNAVLLNETGEKIAEEKGLKWLPSDFKKKGGYQRSIELSKELNLYRQNYCGCEFSKNKNPIF